MGGGGGTSQAVALLGLLKKEGIYFGSEVTNVATGEGCLLSGIDRLPLAIM